jgi:hypothetical protein
MGFLIPNAENAKDSQRSQKKSQILVFFLLRLLRNFRALCVQVYLYLDCSTNHEFFDFAYGFGGVQAFGADVHAVHDGVAAEEAIRIFQIV